MLNDYYSYSFLPIEKYNYIEELNIISRFYRSLGVDRIFLAREYNPSVTVNEHLKASSAYFTAARKSLCSGIKIVPIHTVSLYNGISATDCLERLAHKSGKNAYLYIKIPLGTDRELITSELHRIIYKRKLIPVFVEAEVLPYIITKQAFETVLSVPNAVYQISLSRMADKSCRELFKSLVRAHKNVAFGSGSSFDACPYQSTDFYLRQISRALGKNKLGLFLLRHNRIF